jgi:hypothetical protein
MLLSFILTMLTTKFPLTDSLPGEQNERGRAVAAIPAPIPVRINSRLEYGL